MSEAPQDGPQEGPREPPQDLPQRLREADARTLSTLVATWAPTLDVPAARQVLRNPFAGREVIEQLLEVRRLRSSREMQGALARHPHTPQPVALRFVASLFWRDLLALVTETRVRPVVRRAADRTLLARLAGLGAGEKIAIARRASLAVLREMGRDPDPRVMRALLENPRLTQGVLLPSLTDETAAPAVLKVVAEDRRWGRRYEVRWALARNPRTPTAVALSLLPHLKKRDLLALARDSRVAAPVRRRAEVLTGQG